MAVNFKLYSHKFTEGPYKRWNKTIKHMHKNQSNLLIDLKFGKFEKCKDFKILQNLLKIDNCTKFSTKLSKFS